MSMAKRKHKLSALPKIGLPATTLTCQDEVSDMVGQMGENGCVGYAMVTLHADGGVLMQWNDEHARDVHYKLLGGLQQLCFEMSSSAENVLEQVGAD